MAHSFSSVRGCGLRSTVGPWRPRPLRHAAARDGTLPWARCEMDARKSALEVLDSRGPRPRRARILPLGDAGEFGPAEREKDRAQEVFQLDHKAIAVPRCGVSGRLQAGELTVELRDALDMRPLLGLEARTMTSATQRGGVGHDAPFAASSAACTS